MLNKTNPVLKDYKNSPKSELTAELLVKKIFGADGIYARIETRWKAYESHQEWRSEFLKSKERGSEPIYLDEKTGDVISGSRALDPCPLINGALSELVGLAIDSYQEGVVKEFYERVNADPETKTKLANIPAISAYSEGEMEKFYAQAALDRIEKPYNGSVVMADEAVKKIKYDAELRVKNYLSENGFRYISHYNEQEKMNIFGAADSKDSELVNTINTARKLFRLDETLQPFPYTHNYEHLAYGEKFLIENPAGHGNFPKSLQTIAQKIALPANDPEALSDASRLVKLQNPDIFGVEDLDEKYMTFVGSGALPLTGFVNQIITGCNVNLIDVDPEAVELSQKLRTHLEFLGVLEKDAVSVYIEHGNQVHYGGPREDGDRLSHRGQRFVVDGQHFNFNTKGELSSRESEDLKYIPTDILYIASLIPNNIKRGMVKNLEENKIDPVPVTIVRSARGLSSMLYEPIHEAENDLIGSSPRYHEYGSIIPKRHTESYGNPHVALSEDYISPVSITALLSDDNVNTAHIYHRSALPLINPHVVFLPDSSFDKQAKKDLEEDGGRMDYSYLTQHGPALLKQMKQELTRFAKSKGYEINTDFLNPDLVDSAQTSQTLIEAYRNFTRQFTEVKQQLSR